MGNTQIIKAKLKEDIFIQSFNTKKYVVEISQAINGGSIRDSYANNPEIAMEFYENKEEAQERVERINSLHTTDWEQV